MVRLNIVYRGCQSIMINTDSHTLHNCKQYGCFICENELTFCEVCKGGEGNIPTDCPGKPLNEHQISYIVNEALDFIDGEWKYKTKAYGEI